MANKKQKYIYRDLSKTKLDELLKILKKEGSLKVNGLGIFKIKRKRAIKVVNNLNGGKVVDVPERNQIVFIPILAIKKYINHE